MPTKMIRIVDAVLVIAVDTALTAGANVGIGLAVETVVGGTMQASPSSFLTRPSWQMHSWSGFSSVDLSAHVA